MSTSNDYLFDSMGRYRRERFVAPAEITLADELTEAQYEIADTITLWLEAHAGAHSRSVIARGVKADYQEVATALAWLDRNRMIAADGNGCWRKYAARR